MIDHQLLPAIAQGNKVAITTDNRVYAGKLESIIRKQFPDIELLLVHGKNKNEANQRDFLKQCDREAKTLSGGDLYTRHTIGRVDHNPL